MCKRIFCVAVTVNYFCNNNYFNKILLIIILLNMCSPSLNLAVPGLGQLCVCIITITIHAYKCLLKLEFTCCLSWPSTMGMAE